MGGDVGEVGVDMVVGEVWFFVIFRIFLVFLVVVFGRDQKWGTNGEDRALKLKSLFGFLWATR